MVASYAGYDSISSLRSSVKRGGDWQVADRLRVRAILGAAELDFRRAELPADGVVEIECQAICGEIQLTVPAGSEVELEGVRVFVGGLQHRSLRPRSRDERRAADSDRGEEQPLFVLSGRIVCGAIQVVGR
jgi:hypothetical protein